MGVKILSEHLVGSRVYCQNCGNTQNLQYGNNNPAADFFCGVCHEDYQLKSQRKHLGAKGMDGAYPAMIRRLSGNTIPNLFLLNYDFRSLTITDLLIVPKHFFTTTIIEERKPLPPTAKQAGWVGWRISLEAIPQAGKMTLIRNGVIEPKANFSTSGSELSSFGSSKNRMQRAGLSRPCAASSASARVGFRWRRFTPLKMNFVQHIPVVVISEPR
jgi:type II restriction enzyme